MADNGGNPSYIYTPLSGPWAIRVLTLQLATKFKDPLVGTLREINIPTTSPRQLLTEKAAQLGCQNLADIPDAAFEEIFGPLESNKSAHYEALSYVCGDKSKNFSIICDKKALAITNNCDEALRYLREHNKDRVLWVDAICIDQISDSEKSAQVELMGHIYKSAISVIIWLGPSAVDSDVISTEARWGKWVRDTLPVAVSRKVLGTPKPEREMVPAIIQSPWYTRVWTFQEQLLPLGAVYVKWGEYEMHYVDFQQMRGTWHEDEEQVGEARRLDIHRSYKNVLQQLRPPKRQVRNLWMQILHAGRLLQCSDPRDRLYGLFGVLQESGMSVPRPDYTMSAQLVFEDFIRHVIRTERSLWILICTIGMKRNLQLPSWVPDWTVDDAENNLAIFQAMELVFGPYDATLSSSVDLQLLSTGVSPPGKLALKARIVSKIAQTAGKFPMLTPGRAGDIKSAIPQFISWFLCAFMLGGLDALERLRLLIWSANSKATTVKDHEFGTVTSSFFYEVSSSGFSLDDTDLATYQQMVQVAGGADPGDRTWISRLAEISEGRDGMRFIRRVWQHFHGATLFCNAFAEFGVSWALLPEINATDESSKRFFVALLAGSNVPVILSTCADEGVYELLGPAFVLGIMNAEVWSRNYITGLGTIILC